MASCSLCFCAVNFDKPSAWCFEVVLDFLDGVQFLLVAPFLFRGGADKLVFSVPVVEA